MGTPPNSIFARSKRALSLADSVVLVPIYPAREEPIEGICSELIGEYVTAPWHICERERLAEELYNSQTDVVVTFGAGNIDVYCEAIAAHLARKA